MRKKCFTIIELLVAIGITTILVNLLSSIYIRVNSNAMDQVGLIGVHNDVIGTLNALESDLKRIKCPAYMVNNGTPEARLKFDKVNLSFNTTTSTYTVPSVPGAYSYFVFTAEPSPSKVNKENFANGTYRGLEEVAYLLAPKVTNGSIPSIIDENLMTLYRKSNLTGASSLFSETNLSVNDDQIVAQNLLWMSFEFVQDNGSTTLRAWSGSGASSNYTVDSNSDFRGNTINRVPNELNLTITTAPTTGAYSLTALAAIPSGSTVTIYDDESETSGLLRSRPFTLSRQGHIVNITRNSVYWYKKVSPNQLTITTIGSSTAMAQNDELLMGVSSTKTFPIQ